MVSLALEGNEFLESVLLKNALENRDTPVPQELLLNCS